MKKIINGKQFNTETAKFLGCAFAGTPGTFEYYGEDLYLTKSGNYFLYGEGGALSPYATWSGDNRGPGEKIVPMSEDGAKKWAEENLSGDEYENIFGEVEESTTQISATITNDVKEMLDTIKKETKETTSEFIERLIKEENNRR